MLRVLCVLVSLVSYKNPYHQFLHLVSESASLPGAERAAKANAVWDRFVRCHASLEYLSLREEVTEYWCTEGHWRSYLPMELWPKRVVGVSVVASTAENLHTEILQGDNSRYSLFLFDTRYWEFRWPTQSSPGDYLEYPYDGKCWRLTEDVPLHCSLRAHAGVWVGDGTKTQWYRHLVDSGYQTEAVMRSETYIQVFGGASWIGVMRVDGKLCDVLFLSRDSHDRKDVFWIDMRGFMVMWFVIHNDPTKPVDKRVTVKSHRDFDTGAIAAEEFVPSEALLRRAQSWRKNGG